MFGYTLEIFNEKLQGWHIYNILASLLFNSYPFLIDISIISSICLFTPPGEMDEMKSELFPVLES